MTALTAEASISPLSRRLLTLAVSSLALVSASACAALIDFPDVPAVGDGGADAFQRAVDAGGHDSGHGHDATTAHDSGKHDATAPPTDAHGTHPDTGKPKHDAHANDVAEQEGGRDAHGRDAAADATRDDAGVDGGRPDAARTDARRVDAHRADADRDSGRDAGVDAPRDTGVDAPPGDAGTPPSCLGSPSLMCGNGTLESCCVTVDVTGGHYNRTYSYTDAATPDGPLDAGSTPATVASFRLDKYLVTVGRFRVFQQMWSTSYVDAGLGGAACDAGHRYYPAERSGKHAYLGDGLTNVGSAGGYEYGWFNAGYDCAMQPTTTNLTDPSCPAATWTATPGADESLPINCLSWQEAYAFCIWDGGFLPSEAEWEYAAGGGSALDFPWGTVNPANTTNPAFYAIYGCLFGPYCAEYPGVTNLAAVGQTSIGAGPYGQLDPVGEVREWVLDEYAPYVVPSINGAYTDGDAATGGNSARGASFSDGARYLHPWYRDETTNSSFSRSDQIGVRCARAPAH